MTRSDLTHLYFLLDRSGSMQSIKTDIEGGFAAFIEEQQAAPGRCRVTLAQFDDQYDVVYADRDVAVRGLRMTREIMASPALARYRPEEVLPGPQVVSDDDLRSAASELGTTIFHPVGTCAMGAFDTRGVPTAPHEDPGESTEDERQRSSGQHQPAHGRLRHGGKPIGTR